jgi:ParB-like chromosome segregation protein Spo0J
MRVSPRAFLLEKKMREQHPLSKAFPPMSEEELQNLIDSIEDIGVQNAIVIFENKVIDGWHRYTVATDMGMPCPEVDLADDVNPRDFVLSQNKSRRHLNKGQLAMAYTKVYEWYPVGTVASSLLGMEQRTGKELAKMAGTSTATIEQAKVVLKKGNEDVVKAVETGKISVKRGAEISKLDKDKQKGAITAPKEPKPSILEGNAPSDEELKANDLAMQADLEVLNKLLEADEPLKVAHAEIKRLNFLLAQQEVRLASIMREKSECIKLCKKQQTQLDKFYKSQK